MLGIESKKWMACDAQMQAQNMPQRAASGQNSDNWQRKGFCDVDCMAAHGMQKAREAKAKKERKKTRAAKERLKTLSDHAREAQQAFNAWIRERDARLPCISCGRHHQGQYHAGHYRTVGSHPELRFEPLNVHKQCAPCNNHKSGNIVEYRINLLDRIGKEALEWLEGPHKPRKYRAEELKEIKAEYRRKFRELQRQNSS